MPVNRAVRFYAAFALLLSAGASRAQTASVVVVIDARASRHAIDPRIYGLAFADSATLSDLNVPLNRYGGNDATCYNWKLNASNHAADWYFESIGDDSPVAGERGDTFIANSFRGGAQPMITIPMIGWAARLGPNRSKLASFSIAKYGPQTDSDKQWLPDAGNGIAKATGKPITGNDPADASVAVDSSFQQDWAKHLVARWGNSRKGGVRYYLLDNESSIWHSTHRDVHPIGAKMEEIRDKILDYAAKIRAVDPNALILGPEEWGWSGYLYSGYDQQWGANHGWTGYPDRKSHGGEDYLPWLLDQIRQNDAKTGKRSLDFFTVHYYPQGGETGTDVSNAMQLLRNRSTRSLWDPSYVDASWINDKVRLIPRLKQWASAYYPGLKIGITEYNWGAESHINGATAQADILGIFGREGLDLATRWTTPAANTPTYKAIKIYRNYDGAKSGFGDVSVSAVAPNPDDTSAFAAIRSGGDHALTVMVVRKALSGSASVTLDLRNYAAGGSARAWQLTSANRIVALPNPALSENKLQATIPAQSITLFVIPPAPGATFARDRNPAEKRASDEK